MGKYFGTDGVRGVAGADLTCELAMKIGRGAAAVLTGSTGHRPRILIGKDTRQSGDMLEAALTAGLCSVGADVESLGVLPTPLLMFSPSGLMPRKVHLAPSRGNSFCATTAEAPLAQSTQTFRPDRSPWMDSYRWST